VAGRRRGDQALPATGARFRLALELRVAADAHSPVLHRSRISGPCHLRFAEPMLVIARRRAPRRLVPVATEPKRAGVMVDHMELDADQRVEIRP
jgi:hypothetical protein